MSADSPRSRAVKWHRSELGCSGPLALHGPGPSELGHLGAPGTEGISLGLGGSSRHAQLVLLGTNPRTRGRGVSAVPRLGAQSGPPTPRGSEWAPPPSGGSEWIPTLVCSAWAPPTPRGFRVDPHPRVLSVGPPHPVDSVGPPRVVSGPGHGGQQPRGQRGAAPACSVSVSLYPAGWRCSF